MVENVGVKTCRGVTKKMPRRKLKGQGKCDTAITKNLRDLEKSEYEWLRDANVALLKQQMMPVVAVVETLAKSCHKTRRSNQRAGDGETQPLRRSKRAEEDLHKGDRREDDVNNTIDSDSDSEDVKTSDDGFFERRDKVVVDDSEDELLQAPENILCTPIAKEKGKGKTISFVDNSGGRGVESRDKAVNGGTNNVPSHNPWPGNMQIPGFPTSWMSQGCRPWMQTQGWGSPLQGGIPWMNLGGDWFKQEEPSASSMPINVDPTICTQPPHQETLGRKVENEHRSLNRLRKREINTAGERRRAQGLKPFKVKVQRGGVIDTGCEGKNQWDDMRRKRNRSPGLTEIADDIRDQEQVSTASVGSARLQSRVTSLEKRFVEMDEKLSIVLERSTLVLSMLGKVVGSMDNLIKSNVMDKSGKSDASDFQANNDVEEKYDGEEDDGIDNSDSARWSAEKGGVAEKCLRAKNITTMFEVGDEVCLLNPSELDTCVAVGTVISCSSAEKIHGESIPDAYVKVCVTKAICPDVELMKQNPNGDQFKIMDVAGSFTIWKKQYLMKV